MLASTMCSLFTAQIYTPQFNVTNNEAAVMRSIRFGCRSSSLICGQHFLHSTSSAQKKKENTIRALKIYMAENCDNSFQ